MTLGALVALAPSEAQAVSYTFDSSIVEVVPPISEVAIYGDMMDGLQVTVFFAVGGQDTKTWGDTGPGAGGAFGTGWSLTLSGDTFENVWVYSGSAITALSLSGLGACSVIAASD